MTEQQLAEAKLGFEFLARAAMSGHTLTWRSEVEDGAGATYFGGEHFAAALSVRGVIPEDRDPRFKRLDVGQVMALGVLLGDKSVLPHALADFLIESGTEPAQPGEILFKKPAYPRGEDGFQGRMRWRDRYGDRRRGLQEAFRAVVRDALRGRASPGVGLQFSRFVREWFGVRWDLDDRQTGIPTDEHLEDRFERFPPLLSVVKYLVDTTPTGKKSHHVLVQVYQHLKAKAEAPP